VPSQEVNASLTAVALGPTVPYDGAVVFDGVGRDVADRVRHLGGRYEQVLVVALGEDTADPAGEIAVATTERAHASAFLFHVQRIESTAKCTSRNPATEAQNFTNACLMTE